ncbi:MAG: deoxyuridine 5'-triphosphate nucleotidohydrolase [Chloroflexota bacterium]|nr:deoxyuridine 5'-triphosphate nucleotidohydrolase [Chloroflexota bacterium]
MNHSTAERTGAAFIEDAVDLETQTQPNGVELTLARIDRFAGSGTLAFDNSERQLPATEEVPFDSEGWVWLPPGAYKVGFNELVRVPADRFAIARPRSSLLRMGVSLPSALWDSGYNGRGEGLLVVHNPHGLRVRRNARLVQLVFFTLSAPVEHPYNGRYQEGRSGPNR